VDKGLHSNPVFPGLAIGLWESKVSAGKHYFLIQQSWRHSLRDAKQGLGWQNRESTHSLLQTTFIGYWVIKISGPNSSPHCGRITHPHSVTCFCSGGSNHLFPLMLCLAR
jgi:hypothetical protein